MIFFYTNLTCHVKYLTYKKKLKKGLHFTVVISNILLSLFISSNFCCNLQILHMINLNKAINVGERTMSCISTEKVWNMQLAFLVRGSSFWLIQRLTLEKFTKHTFKIFSRVPDILLRVLTALNHGPEALDERSVCR